MPTWNADQYLKFAYERTQPAMDLAAREVPAAPSATAFLSILARCSHRTFRFDGRILFPFRRLFVIAHR
jgi:trans-aconitate methyltransferase